MNRTTDNMELVAARAATLAIACGVLLLLLATTFAGIAGVIAIMNQRVMGPRYWLVLAGAVVLSFVPGTAYVVFAGPVRRLRFWAVVGALILASIQTVAALGLLVYMLYFSTSGLNGFLFLAELACFALGLLLAFNLQRVIASACARPGFGFDAQLRSGSPERPIPVLQHVDGEQQVGDGVGDDARAEALRVHQQRPDHQRPHD